MRVYFFTQAIWNFSVLFSCTLFIFFSSPPRHQRRHFSNDVS